MNQNCPFTYKGVGKGIGDSGGQKISMTANSEPNFVCYPESFGTFQFCKVKTSRVSGCSSQLPRRSAKVTHFCSFKVTHTENTIWNSFLRGADYGPALSSTPQACGLDLRHPRRRRV